MTKHTMPNENAIRDAIAAKLDLIEPGLTLIKREHHLPNPDGAAGFLDILAQSASGQVVIIEIKRTKSSAREALQELHKYAALIRADRALKHTDYRLMLLSVEWDDLITAYSEHKAHSPYDLSAGRIVLGDDGLPISIESVQPIAVADEREIARRHFIWHFITEGDARAAIPIIATHMRASGLKDFVLVLIELHPNADTRYALYFAQQQLSLDVYLTLIRARLDPELMAEFEENLADYTEAEDMIGEASDQVWLDGEDLSMPDFVHRTAEISGTEKASNWFHSGVVVSREIHRFGRFDSDSISDDALIAEIEGLGGESDFRLDYAAAIGNAPQLARLRKAISNVFFFNPVWRSAANDLVDYAIKTKARSIRIRAFSNEDILLAVATAAFHFPKFHPQLQIDIERDGAPIETIMGLVEWNGAKPDFDHVVKTFFDGDPWAYFMQRHFGEHRARNIEVMAALGLEFGVFRRNGEQVERVRVNGTSLMGAPVKPRILFEFTNNNVEEVTKIVDMFMEHDQGFQVTIGRYLQSGIAEAERALDQIVKGEPRAHEERYWAGTLDHCDLCPQRFRECRYMIDAILKRGVGANVCAVCFHDHGRGIGKGSGQVYTQTHRGWLLVAG